MKQLQILFLLWLTILTAGQQVPPIACPQYFEYLSFNREFVGRITVQHDPQYQENIVRVEFSQHGRLGSVSEKQGKYEYYINSFLFFFLIK